ncbi:MAG TPA: HK97 gp10 family phage protein [Ferruginibacter sp.]|nr:HK97 gp10 family phage protein [Ferruginibacter sp.]
MLKIQLKGLDNLIATVEKTAKRAEVETKVALTKFAKNTETEAKRLAPANEGRLRNSISGTVEGFSAKLTVTADYAAYLEFGTRKFAARYVATLPQEWKSYAATFRGKTGGSFDQFIQDIMQWVRQKGIGGLKTKSGRTSESKDSLDAMQQAAYAIAINILQNGVRPHPFVYPSVKQHIPVLEADIKKVFTV